jgi:hypothetical protein
MADAVEKCMNKMDVPHKPAKRRLGCLGSIAAFFVVGGPLVLLIDVVFAPWSFYLGGSFHWVPMWQGWGRLHSRTAGDYVLFVRMLPSPAGSRAGFGGPNVTGVAYLCTPRGERFTLRLGGDALERFWLNSEGKRFHLYMYRWPGYFESFTVWDRRPRIDLVGRWNDPNLVMDDHGTLSRAFNEDGSFYSGRERFQPAARETLQITFKEGRWSDFDSACGEKQR